MHTKTIKDLLIITVSTLAITFLIWLPHLLKVNFYSLDFSQGFQAIYRNYDGLEYIVIAKSFYNPEVIAKLPQSLPATYFPAHFPGFPILIALFATVLGFLKSMIFVSMLFTVLSAFAFYFLVRDFNLSKHHLWLSVVFLILPARWVILHSVGSGEPIFIFAIILSIYFFKKFEDQGSFKNILLSGIFVSLAQFTRPPGILLAISLGIYLLYRLIKKQISLTKILNYWPLILGPLTLLGVFFLYQIQLGDFWAYFHTGDNIHLNFPPFQVFNRYQFWVGDIWLEDIVYIFLLGLLGGLFLLKSFPVAGFFVLTFLAATSLVAHRDISRYALPIFPFVIIAFQNIVSTKEFKITLVLLALAIYLYSQNFLIENVGPYPNLSAFN